MPAERRFVYVLKSVSDASRYYTGLTTDMPSRLTELRTKLRTKLKLPKKTIDEIEAHCGTVSS